MKEISKLPNLKTILETSIEDGVFALCGMYDEKLLNVAPLEAAKLFSMEWYPERHVKRLGNELPFGCHGWTKFSADFYVELFAKFGYDLRPFRAQMLMNNYEKLLSQYLNIIAMERLNRKVECGHSLLRYLPTKKFASVRVIKSPDAMKILARLLIEENSLTDKIFIYDKENDLIRDVIRETLPHLVLCTDYDKSLIGAIEQKGLVYGEHVISFQQEYLKVQEKIFHNLGR